MFSENHGNSGNSPEEDQARWRAALAEQFPGLNPSSAVASLAVDLYDQQALTAAGDAEDAEQEWPESILPAMMLRLYQNVINDYTSYRWETFVALHSSIYESLQALEEKDRETAYESVIRTACETKIDEISQSDNRALSSFIKNGMIDVVEEAGVMYRLEPGCLTFDRDDANDSPQTSPEP